MRVTETMISIMKAKIDTLEGRAIYSRRLAIAKPVFANLAARKGMSRPTLQTRAKVDIQWKLYCICMVHNLEKLAKRAFSRN